jgi:hypothetical protein
VTQWTPRLNQLLPDIEAQDPQMAELIRHTAEVLPQLPLSPMITDDRSIKLTVF